MLRYWTFCAFVAAIVLAVPACSDSSADAEPQSPASADPGDQSAGNSSGAVEGIDPWQDPAGKPDRKGGEVFIGDVDVQGEVREVVGAWLGYQRVVGVALSELRIPDTLHVYASGAAKTDVTSTVELFSDERLRSVGDILVDVEEVDVQGDKATVLSCSRYWRVDVDESGKPLVEKLSTPFRQYRDELVRTDSGWKVSDATPVGSYPYSKAREQADSNCSPI